MTIVIGLRALCVITILTSHHVSTLRIGTHNILRTVREQESTPLRSHPTLCGAHNRVYMCILTFIIGITAL